MSAGPAPVPLPASLPAVVLSYLVPAPNPPLPPEILSLALTQLHTYLPPPLDDPVAHFLPSSNVSAEVKQRVADAVHEIGRLMGESEVGPGRATSALGAADPPGLLVRSTRLSSQRTPFQTHLPFKPASCCLQRSTLVRRPSSSSSRSKVPIDLGGSRASG